ncbi:MAG: outer membrane beta-barrel protein [Candidatus Aminicenantia bacterium]
MKRLPLIMLFFLLFFPLLSEDRFLVGLSGGYYSISDSSFKEIYNSGAPIYGGILGFNISKELQIVGTFKFFSTDGKTTYIKEDLTFSMNPLTLAFRYRFGKSEWLFKPYLGAGFDYYSYKEDVKNETEFLRDTSDSVFGYSIQGGGSLKLMKNLFAEINFKYTIANAKPYETEVELGGFELGAGLLFVF